MYENLSILELQSLMTEGKLTSVILTNYYIKRIHDIDQGDTMYNAVYMINPDALDMAVQLDDERSKGKVRSKMHGIPVLIKDNISTGDQQTTTAGTNILKDYRAREDATLVKVLREQGAIILGKTNLTELACFKTFSGVNGYSSLAGQVLFPWDIKEDPSGSSTGSAVAEALRLAPVSIGTETGGSIMSPAMRNGVVGLKPTIGLVPRTGIIPISHTLDTAGPMGNRVSDVAVLLSSMRYNDPKDRMTLNKEDIYVDYTKYLSTHEVKRIGIVRQNAYPISEHRKDMFEQVCKRLERLGYELIPIEVKETKDIYMIMKHEFKHDLNITFKEAGLNLTLKDIIDYNNLHKEDNLKYGQAILVEAQEQTTGKMDEEVYLKALKEREETIVDVNNIFDDFCLDVIYFIGYTSIGPECGFPTLTIPVGFDEKHYPYGTYFLAKHDQEGKLIELGYRLEQDIKMIFNPLKKA